MVFVQSLLFFLSFVCFSLSLFFFYLSLLSLILWKASRFSLCVCVRLSVPSNSKEMKMLSSLFLFFFVGFFGSVYFFLFLSLHLPILSPLLPFWFIYFSFAVAAVFHFVFNFFCCCCCFHSFRSLFQFFWCSLLLVIRCSHSFFFHLFFLWSRLVFPVVKVKVVRSMSQALNVNH